MKTTDERMARVLKQVSSAREKQRRQHQRIAAWSGGAACAVVLMVVSLAISSVSDFESATSLSGGESGLTASVFAGSTTFGYLVVGLLGAMLGVALTVLVHRLGRDGNTGGSTKRDDCAGSLARQDDGEW